MERALHEDFLAFFFHDAAFAEGHGGCEEGFLPGYGHVGCYCAVLCRGGLVRCCCFVWGGGGLGREGLGMYEVKEGLESEGS